MLKNFIFMRTETLHREHRDWLSEIGHWEQELTFLSHLTGKIQSREVEESLQKAAGEFESQAYHLQMELNRLKAGIQEHELFLTTSDSDARTEEQTHSEMRDQMREFRESFYELKRELFQLAREAL
jgi:hypothetical protein